MVKMAGRRHKPVSYLGQSVLSELPEEVWNRATSLTGGLTGEVLKGEVTSEIAEDDWERGWT